MTASSADKTSLENALSALDPLCNALTKERPLTILLLISLVAACVYCFFLFDANFVLGTSPYWDNPRGILPRSWADISTALSGYLYFQRDTWQLPLFHVTKLGAPAGTNIIFTDSIPWVALAGKIVFHLTGRPLNLYGLWVVFCFLASAVTMTGLVAILGQRNIAAVAMATVTGLCMPALLARWGHMSLMAQFEIPLALIFYLKNRRDVSAQKLVLQAAGLLWLSLWTHTYIFVMIGAIVFATIAQAWSDRALSTKSVFSILAALAILLGAIIALSGNLQSQGPLSAEGVGIFSMNLLSPFFPQRSGLYPSFRNVIADGTGGQYEGFSYLGMGILMLLLMTSPWQLRRLRESWRHHTWLLSLFLCFTLFALSNIIYLGPLQLVHISLPDKAMQFAAIFRSTGRFFWPVMYSIAALAIAAPVALYGRYGVFLLCLAAPLQWIDSTPLRSALAASTRAPAKPHIDLAVWEAAIRQHSSLRVLPQFVCLGLVTDWNSELAAQLQLLAAFSDRPTNTVYAARFAPNCRAEQRMDGMPRAGTRQLSVFLDKFSGFERMRKYAATSAMCRAGGDIVVCSDIPGESNTLNSLTDTDRK